MKRTLYYVEWGENYPLLELTSAGKIPEGCLANTGNCVFANEALALKQIEMDRISPVLKHTKFNVRSFDIELRSGATHVAQVVTYENPWDKDTTKPEGHEYGYRHSPFFPSLYAAQASDPWNEALQRLRHNNYVRNDVGHLVPASWNCESIAYPDGTWHYESREPFTSFDEKTSDPYEYVKCTARINLLRIVEKEEDIRFGD